jgi:hypothetical protein
MRFDGKSWQPPISVTGGGLDVWRPTVTLDGQGAVWVAWSQQVDGDWEILYRRYVPPRTGEGDGQWSESVQLTRSKGSDFHKGYRLGFQSSNDHTSTHWSYAVVLAEDTSRQAIIDAFRKRHCYAATDNILVDVRSGEHLMGDLFTTSSRPTLEIQVFGTTPIARLHVIRNNRYVFSTEPKAREVSLRYTDDDQELKPGQTYYYYVRIEQSDRNLARGVADVDHLQATRRGKLGMRMSRPS